MKLSQLLQQADVIRQETTVNANTATRIGQMFIDGYEAGKKNNHILVNELSDLPTPVSGVIQLESNTSYEMDGIVDLGTNSLQYGQNSIVYGQSSRDGLLYTGNGNALIANNVTLTLQKLTLRTPNGTAFNFVGNQNDVRNIFIDSVVIPESGIVGVIQDFSSVVINNVITRGSITNGISLNGSNLGDIVVTNSRFYGYNTGANIIQFGTNANPNSFTAISNIFDNGTGVSAIHRPSTVNTVEDAVFITNRFNDTVDTLSGTFTDWYFLANFGVDNNVDVGAGDVESVNGLTGVVVLDTDDVSEGINNLYFTSAERTKLQGIETGAEVNPTASEIKTLYESNVDTNVFTDSEKTKLGTVQSGAEQNVNADWNAISGDSFILNKPSIPSSSLDLSDAGDLVRGGDNISRLNNDAGYITNAQVSGDVASVNGQNGVVTLDSDDIPEGVINLYHRATNLDIIGTGNSRTITSSTGVNVVIPIATQTVAGFMSYQDKVKLDTIDSNVSGETNLGFSGTGDVVYVTSDTGTDAQLPTATTTVAGVMSIGDKSKLDGIESGAEVNSTATEIKTLYEGNTNTNAFTDSYESKLIGIESGAQVNVNTNLGITGIGDNRSITSSTGTNVAIPTVTTTTAGFMSFGDKTKLDGIEAGAQVNVGTDLTLSQTTTDVTVISSTGTSVVIPTATGTLAGVLSSNDKSKLDGIETGAEVNQTNSEIKTQYEANLNTNAFTDAYETKLIGIEAGAQVNVGTDLSTTINVGSIDILSSTGTNITLPSATQTLSGVFSSTDKTKLDGIEAGAQVNVGTDLSVNYSDPIGLGEPVSVFINSSTGSDTSIAGVTQSVPGVMGPTDKIKLDGIEAGAQVNVDTNLGITGTGDTRTITSSTGTGVTVPVVTLTDAGFMSIGDKSKLNGIEAGAQVNVPTDLSLSVSTTEMSINSSTGTNVVLSDATQTLPGVMSPADKTKLDGIEVGAEVNVQSDWNAVSGDAFILNKPDIVTLQQLNDGIEKAQKEAHSESTRTATWTLTEAELGTVIRVDSPNEITVSIPTGLLRDKSITTIRQVGAGRVKVVGETGVTTLGTLTTGSQNSALHLYKVDGLEVYDVYGGIPNDLQRKAHSQVNQTSGFTLTQEQLGTVVRIDSATDVNVTIPAGLTEDLWVTTFRQVGAGKITLVAGVGVTLLGNLNSGGQHTSIQTYKVEGETDTYDVTGGIA